MTGGWVDTRLRQLTHEANRLLIDAAGAGDDKRIALAIAQSDEKHREIKKIYAALDLIEATAARGRAEAYRQQKIEAEARPWAFG